MLEGLALDVGVNLRDNILEIERSHLPQILTNLIWYLEF